MIKDDCIFCKIANGDIPSATVYEDKDMRAILDIAPGNHGHVLILPKDHYSNIFELDKTIAEKIMAKAIDIATAVKTATNCDGVNLVQNNGEAAGQTVMHFHLHIIPRFTDDTVNVGWVPGEYADGEAAKMAEAIKAQLN